MVRYLSGDELKPSEKINGVRIFLKGCFNCRSMSKMNNNVSGICPYVKVDIWKDWTCELHDPIKPII
jgi:hypothetical protein